MVMESGPGHHAKVVAVANQKGGVGKTTTAVNLAACLGTAGYRTLLVDLDPQANATSGLGVHPDSFDVSVYDGLLGRVGLADLVRTTRVESLYLLPSSAALAGAEVELVSLADRSFRLRQLIEPYLSQFSFVFVDCPPSLNLLTLNALCAADSVMVPIQCEYYALEGMGRLLSTLEMVKEHLNPGLKIEGFVLTMFDPRNNLAHQVAREVSQHFGELTFRSIIPRNVRLSESPSYGKPIIQYDRMCRGAHSYLDLTDEFLRSNPDQLAA